jgi:hypothetical protein
MSTDESNVIPWDPRFSLAFLVGGVLRTSTRPTLNLLLLLLLLLLLFLLLLLLL